MSEFSDRPFVAGSLIGLRAFAVDGLGRLRGPSFDTIFTPAENVATCRKNEYGSMASLSLSMSMFLPAMPSYGIDPSTGNITVTKPKPISVEAVEKREREHVLAGVDCKCGFYAYFDGGNDYKQSDRVTAIIEGYGVCTVGSRGFRAGKAKLVALVSPGRRFPEARRPLLARNYPDVPMYDRKRDALAAHPLSSGVAPSPETDDNFWTRAEK